MFRVVVFLGHVPFDLIDEGSVADVDVEFDDDSLVAGFFNDLRWFGRKGVQLLSYSLRDCGHEGQGVQIEVVA